MITFDKTIHDFGLVNQGDPLIAKFQYTGDSLITIQSIQTSCGCTTKEYDAGKKEVTLTLANPVTEDKSGTIQQLSTTINVGGVTLILKALTRRI